MADENQGAGPDDGTGAPPPDEGHLPPDGGAPPEHHDDEGGGAPPNGDAGGASKEDIARAMGWAPKEDWRGPAERWVDADTFVERAQKPAIAMERLENVTQQLAEERAARQRDKADFDDRIARLDRVGQLAMKRQREQIVTQYEGLKRAAVDDADTEKYDRLVQAEAQELGELTKEVTDAVGADGGGRQPGQGQQSEVPAVWEDALKEWVPQNTWFQSDRTMANFARWKHVELMDTAPGLTPEENLAKVREAVMEKYPRQFGLPAGGGQQNSQRGGSDGGEPPAPAAEGGSRRSTGSGRSNARTVRNLEPEARAAGERFVKEGLYKDMDEYAKDYYASVDEQAGRLGR